MKVKLKIFLENSSIKNTDVVSAIRHDDVIIFEYLNSIFKIDSNGLKKENNESILNIDFINKKCFYLVKDLNKTMELDIKINKFEVSDSFKIEYEINDEKIVYEIEEV